VARACEICGAPFMVEKSTKRDGRFYACIAEGCGNKEPITETENEEDV